MSKVLKAVNEEVAKIMKLLKVKSLSPTGKSYLRSELKQWFSARNDILRIKNELDDSQRSGKDS
jgi:hypothetical protein